MGINLTNLVVMDEVQQALLVGLHFVADVLALNGQSTR